MKFSIGILFEKQTINLKLSTMKNLFLFISLFLFGIGSFAQNSSFTVFSSGGEKFTLILNGIKINSSPETRVEAKDLNLPNYKARIEFEEKSRGIVEQTLWFEKPQDLVSEVRMNNRGRYVLRVVSISDAVDKPKASVGFIPSETSEPAPAQPSTSHQVKTEVQSDVNTTVTTTTTIDENEEEVKVSAPGININVRMPAAITKRTTVTTKTSSSGNIHEMDEAPQTAPANPTPASPNRCNSSATPADFNSVRGSINSKSFEDSKLTTAKQATRGKCFTSAQIRDIMKLFKFEESRLDYAKFAYDFVFDASNYYLVNEAFTFESSIEDLDNYIGSK